VRNDNGEWPVHDKRVTSIGLSAARGMAIAALLACAATAVQAQTVRGSVFHPDSVTHAAGVIVVVDDERGSMVARALSGSDGDFDLKVPGAGRYRIRLLRVGFRPTVLAPLDVPADGVSGVRAQLGAEAVMLSVVTVRSDDVCGTTDAAGHVIAELWEEARKALTATQLSAGAASLNVEWQVFGFEINKRTQRVDRRVVQQRTGATDRPFVSASADSLADEGYVIDGEHERVFRAPDAAALLSDRFAASHCFRIDRPSLVRPHWVGIAFRPAPGREWLRDIEGTVWLDRATSELRLLEFGYTALPREADDAGVGGFVEFTRFPTGHWLIARWAIRAPVLGLRSVTRANVPGGGGREAISTVLNAYSVTGGELTRVWRGVIPLYTPDATLLATSDASGVKPSRPSACGSGMPEGVTLGGMVRADGRGAPGAVVSVSWAPQSPGVHSTLSTVSDERGAWTIACAPDRLELSLRASSGAAVSTVRTVAPSGSRSVTRLDLELTIGHPQ
jgi:hypothetical protein